MSNDRTIIDNDKSDKTITFKSHYQLYRRIRIYAAKYDISLGALCRLIIEKGIQIDILGKKP